MEPSEGYSIKGDQFMKEAYKKLKGTALLTQVLSSATSSATKAKEPSRQSNYSNKQPPTINYRNGGMTPPRPTSSASSATRWRKADKQQTSTSKPQTWSRKSIAHVVFPSLRVHKVPGSCHSALHRNQQDGKRGKTLEKNRLNIRKR